MIEQYLLSQLDTINALTGKCYPVAAPVGDETLPICLYSRASGEITRDLSGAAAFYRDTFYLHLLGDDMDDLCSLETEVIDTLTRQNTDAGAIYVYSSIAAPGIEDDYDLRTDTFRRSLTCTITYWR